MTAMPEPKNLSQSVATLFIPAVLCLSACADTRDDTHIPDLTSSEPSIVVEITRQDMVSEVTTTGQVTPIREIEIKSKASGEVLRLPVVTGQIVAVSQILAQVDTTEAATAIRQRRAELMYQRAQLRVAADRRVSAEELLSRGMISRDDYHRDVLEDARVRSLIVSTEAALVQANERMAETTVRAPTTGTILQKLVEAGQIITSATSGVSEGTTLLRMADLTAVRVRVLMEQSNIGRIKPGQEVVVTPDAYRDRGFSGRVEKIEPQSVRKRDVTYFPVLIELGNPDGVLLPGMDCTVKIRVSSRLNALTVSSDAVVTPQEARTIAPLLGVLENAVDAAVLTAPKMSDASLGSGIVFVVDSTAAHVRPVVIHYGVRDWNLTDVRSGLTEGMKAVIPPSTSVAEQFRQFEALLERSGVKLPKKSG
jgi:HlyD family secretion protein